jgi:FkbM family methyltransferase
MIIKNIETVETALNLIGNGHSRISFSQFGEDLILWSILETNNKLEGGFYVDVGAFDPWLYSNTALLSTCKGWTGINIDANPEAIDKFNLHRKSDINVLSAVSDNEENLEYAMFNHPGINTLDKAMMEHQRNASHGAYKLEKIINIKTRRLDSILNEYLPAGVDISMLSIDAEGFDLKVLKSNDWYKYRPFIVLVEIHNINLENPHENEVVSLLSSYGYSLVSHCFVTSLFVRR